MEEAITEWRHRMRTAGITRIEILNELEGHLRDGFESQIKSDMNGQLVFEMVSKRVGDASTLKQEFDKVKSTTRRHATVWFAWALFMISLFLPAYMNGRGWQCAALSAEAWTWPDLKRGDWMSIHLGLLTFANVFMAISPFVIARFSRVGRFWNWTSFCNVTSFVLVWSYFLLLISDPIRRDLKAGCHVWAASFLLLFISQFQTFFKTREKYV